MTSLESASPDAPPSGSEPVPHFDPARTVISVDAMGGDHGPAMIVKGMEKASKRQPALAFVLHGPEDTLRPLVSKRKLDGCVVIRDARRVVTMDEKPSQVMRHGKGTSMWSAIDSVRANEATVAVSCGNTGALMAVSMLRLRKLPGVNRPAIACLWPSRLPDHFGVMLDVGADIRADQEDLLQYAIMGVSYARSGLGYARPRVGLLNVGTEDHKGRAELKAAGELIDKASAKGNFDFIGFVEGGDIPSGKVDVIVTDGFTGNVALKTAEGTAGLVRDMMKESFKYSIFTKISALIAAPALKRLSKQIDPRRVNGGVFLGLNGTVVKSHGSADATGVAAAIELAFQLAQSKFNEKLALRMADSLLELEQAQTEDDRVV